MDKVSTKNFIDLDDFATQHSLTSIDKKILKKAATDFLPNVKFKKLDGSVSDALKIIMKPYTLYPYMVKIDDWVNIEKEQRGDEIVRLRVPSINIPAFAGEVMEQNRRAIIYLYLTDGRISNVVDRLDVYLGRVDYNEEVSYKSIDSRDRHLIFIDIPDTVLKKCHCLDAQFEMKIVWFPTMTEPPNGFIEDEGLKTELLNLYKRIFGIVTKYKAPHGIIHGDLHTKNILVSKGLEPIIIDFTHVRKDACVFFDYAKLEHWLQSQLKKDFTKQFFKKGLHLRRYSDEPLILPKSHHGVVKYVNEIRTILWKTCLSNTVKINHEDIDAVNRCFLIYFLIR
ncbi:MAG: hypothetical protein ACOCYO_10840 [Bacteroidota bacterium]